MRILATLTALAVLATPLTPLAIGQSPSPTPKLPACDGVYGIVRHVELKPGVSVDQYMTALAAHQAWYKAHSYDDVIYAARVIERDTSAGTAAYSTHTILSYHYFKPTSQRPARDAQWDAFVKMYTEASDLKESYYSCVPPDHVPHSMR